MSQSTAKERQTMLKHLNSSEVTPERVVILGSGGFVGGTTQRLLEQNAVPVLGLARTDVDLLSPNAADALAGLLNETDSLVVVAANAPCKNAALLLENVHMMNTVCDAITSVKPAHIIYISSDAVYHDSTKPMSESGCAAPGSAHGAMHVAREQMLQASFDGPICILRPSLLYGANGPHNGYGPNVFRRKAAAGEDIVLFGEGEERRDHVFIDDVARIIHLCLMHQSQGILNVATGTVISFKEVAEAVVSLFDNPVSISGSPRSGPMPHNGYRAFDAAATMLAFADFTYTQPVVGFVKVHNESLEAN